MNEHGATTREKRGALHFINTPYQSGVLLRSAFGIALFYFIDRLKALNENIENKAISATKTC
jgi:hypothetical protein